jgi:hypothetical protein
MYEPSKTPSAHLHAVSAPPAQLASGVNVSLQLVTELWQVQEEVLCGADDWLGACQLAAGVDQVSGVHQPATLVTLVATRILQMNGAAWLLSTSLGTA